MGMDAVAQGSTGRERVVVAMSGGVDSSVAALLLVQAGYDVVGVMARLWVDPIADGPANRCCTPQSVDDARRVAALLGIPFYLVNYESEFKSAIVDYFVDEYAHGRTPNPCLVCNREIRFGLFLQQALAMGASHLATGHYARVVYSGSLHHLLKGVDPKKDQSYVLHVLGQEQLAHVLFPLGHLTKPAVRDLARKAGLPVADRAESQDICFLPSGDYRPFVAAHAEAGRRPGPIVDQTGQVIGEHQGLLNYTVGQRHGLGLSSGMPLYVTAIDAAGNFLAVGPAETLLRWTLSAGAVHYVAGHPPAAEFTCSVRLRYQAHEARATVTVLPDGAADIRLEEPQRAVTPGQAVVFYRSEEVLGGGIIDY
jgi:tRNA-uridine 2-sulfurtransferase